MTLKRTLNGYQVAEATVMEKQGYIRVQVAASLANSGLDRVYRAIKAKHIRVRIGANAYTKYVHRGDWLKLMDSRRSAVLRSVGIEK